MRLRSYGTDFFAIQAAKERAQHISYLLPVPRVAPCRPEDPEKKVTPAIISSCDDLLQVSGWHLTDHPAANERETANALAESFERILIEDGGSILGKSSPVASSRDSHLSSQTAACDAGFPPFPVQEGRVSNMESQHSFWSTFRTLEDPDPEVFEADPIQKLEESEFFDQSDLQGQHRGSSPCCLIKLSQEVEIDEEVPVLRRLREKVGLDPGYLQEPLEISNPDTAASCPLIISMLEAEEKKSKCPTTKSSSVNADDSGCRSTEATVWEFEPQELPDVALGEGSRMRNAGLGFLTKPFEDFASQLADQSIDTPDCSNASESDKSSWSAFVEKRVLEEEETGLAEPVLCWEEVLAERSDGVQPREQGSKQPSLEALAEPALIHPLEFFKGLPSNVAKKAILVCTKLNAVVSEDEANGALEEPTAESIENEFHRLVAHPELRMDSFNFNMLPVPYLPCQGPAAETATQIFSSSHARPRSLGGDSLYLDWHLSQSGACNQASCFRFKKKMKAELEPAPVPPEPQQPSANKASVLLAFLAAPEPDEGETSESSRGKRPVEEEALEGEVVFQRESSAAARASEGSVRQRSAFVSKTAGAMTEDLSFFMQARKGTVRARAPAAAEQEPASKKRRGATEKDLGSREASENGKAVQAPSAPAVEVHTVDLPEDHEALLAALRSDYSAILVREKSRLKEKVPGFGVDAAGNRELMALVKRAAASEKETGDVHQQSLRLCATVWTLRQTASNLLDYGVRVAFLYLEHSLQTMPFMSMAVLKSKSALETAYGRVEAGLAIDTPKLACLRDLLKAAVTSGGRRDEQERKILIFADRRAFISMYNELVGAGLRPFQLDRDESILKALTSVGAEAQQKLKQGVEEALTVSNCLLVSYGYLKASFPLNDFGLIVQFSDGRLSNSDTDLNQVEELLAQATCPRHKIGVRGHVEEMRVLKEGVGVPSVPSRGEAQANPPAPVSKPQPSAFPATSRPEPLPTNIGNQIPEVPTRDVQPSQNKPPDRGRRILIVANMLDSEISMRRALYQSVVQLEKSARAQVVERDMALPADLILHGATCLTIFTPERLGLDPLCLDDVNRLAALLPACFQDAVDSHLKAVSFAYKTAVLIFEGPPAFLRATYQELTPLHAAALGLDINLQCLLSDCPDTTNRFVLKLIGSIRTLPKRSASVPPETPPPMPETASPLEAFLTAFPSLNPVSAHAILASGVNAPHFAQLPEEQQVALTRRFDVPVRSLRLFTLQYTVHCGRDPEGGARCEGAIPYGAAAECEAGSAYESAPHQFERDEMGSYGYERRAAEAHQPGRSNWEVPPDRYPQHGGVPQSGILAPGEGPQTYQEDYRMEADVSAPAYPEFPTAAEIEAAREPESEWPSAREIAEQEPVQERGFGHRQQMHVPFSDVEERGYGRREQRRVPYSDGPEAFLQEDLYEGLPFLGRTDFDQVGPFEERSRFEDPAAEGFGGGFEQARPRAGAPTGAATVAAWEDPRDATRARGAGDGLESWLARKRKPEWPQTSAFPLDNQGQKRQRFPSSPALGISTGLQSTRERNGAPTAGFTPGWPKAQTNPRARSVNAPFGRVESAARGGTPSAKRGPGRSRSSGNSGGPGATDTHSDERTERPELQEAIAHFRAYEYVPEAARKAAGGRTAEGEGTHSAESDGGLSTPRPHLMDVPQDKRATEVLGYKRLGRDKQTRLSWGSTPSGRTSSREDGIPPRKIARAGSLATM
ncbi:hypothetical protein KFL_000610350 [Klebsormidium nitens]|uniref:Uncharacterized protein n=1 Tax=Klebsormidium nitens TaxID=105231 RepID=A0A0U9HJ18_KLENI|nr:hypothetical protein KFL_000610350 [Klebsormidium nitens]|eukprot:GAQ80757.1 hypothetical protein KFL_000610350 [Klebsormidium nitens]